MQTAVLLKLSLAGNLEKPLMSLSGTEWRERGYGRVVKTGFCQRGLGQTNEQHRATSMSCIES
jgi:hypothetical protein